MIFASKPGRTHQQSDVNAATSRRQTIKFDERGSEETRSSKVAYIRPLKTPGTPQRMTLGEFASVQRKWWTRHQFLWHTVHELSEFASRQQRRRVRCQEVCQIQADQRWTVHRAFARRITCNVEHFRDVQAQRREFPSIPTRRID